MRAVLANTLKSQQGQMLLITILVLTVATTIALSLIGRSTLDLSMSNQLEESSRAFSAAEAGIEQALESGLGGTQVLTSNVRFNVSVATIGGTNGVYQLQRKTPKGITETVWMVDHNDDGTLDLSSSFTNTTVNLCWSQETVTPALIVSVVYIEGTDGSYKVARTAIDPDASANANNFDDSGIAGSGGCGLSNYYQKQINFSTLGLTMGGASADTLLELRVRPEYSDTTLAIDPGGAALPKQGNRIESTGTTPSGVSRKVVVYQQYRSAGTIFDHVIYSQSSFSH